MTGDGGWRVGGWTLSELYNTDKNKACVPCQVLLHFISWKNNNNKKINKIKQQQQKKEPYFLTISQRNKIPKTQILHLEVTENKTSIKLKTNIP